MEVENKEMLRKGRKQKTKDKRTTEQNFRP